MRHFRFHAASRFYCSFEVMRIILWSENTPVWSINPSVRYILVSYISLFVYYILNPSSPFGRFVFIHISLLALNINMLQQSDSSHIYVFLKLTYMFRLRKTVLRMIFIFDRCMCVCTLYKQKNPKTINAPAMILSK